MKIAATQLENWADTRDAQGMLPVLVRRLISATSTTTALAMPGGESVGLPGWDGLIEVAGGNAWVPDGRSYWELGCSGDVLKKARGDFVKRSMEIDRETAATVAFVFVSPRRWRGKAAWVKEASDQRIWKQVMALDADDLEIWLENAPAVSLWFGEQLGLSGIGIESVARYWENWRAQTQIPLTSDALETGRDQAKNSFGDVLAKLPPLIGIEADSSEEAVAFACSVLLELGYADLACCVTSDEGWRFVDANPNLRIGVALSADIAARRSPKEEFTLVVPLSAGDRPAQLLGTAARAAQEERIVLERPRAEHFEKTLIALGEEQADAVRMVRAVGRSWSVYRRMRAKNPLIRRPTWLNESFRKSLVTITLVGAWSSDKGGDRSCVEAVSGRTYSELEGDLRQLARYDDPPILQIGSVWKAKAPIELLHLLGPEITREELTRFLSVAQNILVKPDPALELEDEKRWMAAVYGKVREESGLVISSIVDSFAKLSVYAERTADPQAGAIKAGIDELVRLLLNNADEQRWLSLSGVLRELAEASPDEFLRAVEASLCLPSAPVRALLTETADSGSFGGRCWHAHLLWALELLAWSPARLARVADILAQLSSTQIKGNWGNSPTNTLHSLFRVWWPQTAATVDQRIVVLDRLIRTHNDVAWNLMYSMASERCSAVANAKPNWRDDDSGTSERPDDGDLGKALEEIGRRLITQARQNPSRIARLVSSLDRFDGEFLAEILRLVDESKSLDDDGREIVRDSVRRYLNWHNSFSRDEDKKSRAAADTLRPYFDALSPVDLIKKHRWLFESSWTDLPDGRSGNFETDNIARELLRAAAIQEILECRGLEGIADLADASQDQRLVGYQLAKSNTSNDSITPWLAGQFVKGGAKSHIPLVSGYLSALSVENRTALLNEIIADPADSIGGAEKIAPLLANAPFDRDTWAIVEQETEAIGELYWKGVNPGYVHGNPGDLKYVLTKLLAAKRPRTAFQAMSLDYKDVEAETLVEILEKIRSGEEDDGPLPGGWHIGQALNQAALSQEIPRRRLALLQFAFFRAVEHGERGAKILYDEIADHPDIFVELVCLAFRRRNGGDDAEEANKAAAELAYHVLHDGRVTPGATDNGDINEAAFRKWIDHVRSGARENDRVEVAELIIGQWLSQCAGDADGNWPCRPVRDFLDEGDSDRIREGFVTGVLNNRGVTSRGMTDGGEQEWALTEKYRDLAKRIQESHPRVAETLAQIEKHYERHAQREDWEAQLRIEGH
ncbi:MAG: hypothetical protein HZB28_10160 [Methylocystis sp.]|nr:hypothetical protein [Methylocystis sp.]